MLGDGDDSNSLAPEHGLEGVGVFSLAGEAGECANENDLKGSLRLTAILDHLPELGPVDDAAALCLVHVLAGDGIAVGFGEVLERPKLGGRGQVDVLPVAGHSGVEGSWVWGCVCFMMSPSSLGYCI